MMKINRRKFVILSFTGLVGFLFLDAFWIEKYIVNWSRHDIREGREDTIKVIQLTDLHIREIKAYHKWISRRLEREKPDLLFFTGDSINRPNQLPLLEEFLKLIPLEIPKIVIMGNKEYDGKVTPEMYYKLFGKYNGKLLINDSISFTKGKRQINIVGVDDLLNGSPDFRKAVKNLNKSHSTIVLNHCPQYRDTIDQLNRELKVKLKLVLCGHTHGGQIQFLGKALYTPGGSGHYVNGWYKSEQSLMYVSKGIGTSYLHMRFGARAEAPIFYI